MKHVVFICLVSILTVATACKAQDAAIPAPVAEPAVAEAVPEQTEAPVAADQAGQPAVWPTDWKNKVEGSRAVAVMAVGDVDPALLDRVVDYAELQVSVKIEKLDAVALEEGMDLYGVAAKAGENLDASYSMIIALVDSPEVPAGQTINIFEKNASAIDLTVLKEGTEDDPELYARRIEKLLNRAICLQLGAPMVRHRQTCLFPYQDLEGLDSMGRGIDPPSIQNILREALKRNVAVYPEGPYFLLRYDR